MDKKYKEKYLKYKFKYLMLGGNSFLNKEEQLKNEKKKYIEIQKKNLKKLKKYEKKFLNGIKLKDFSSLCNEILEIGNTFKYSLKDQLFIISEHNNNNNNVVVDNTNNINVKILNNLIKYYIKNVLENNNISEKLNYLINNSILKLDNKKIKKYDFKNILGRGDFATTYDIGNKMVLKEIDLSPFKISTINNKFFNLQNIINEINIMNTLNESNISPKLIDTWIYNNKQKLYVYILMEHKGISLSEWLKTNMFSDSDDEKIKNKIEELHRYDIIHKDLHKSNILVEEIDGKRDFFIADFGLSKTFKELVKNFKNEDYTRYTINHNDFKINYLKEILFLLDIKFTKM